MDVQFKFSPCAQSPGKKHEYYQCFMRKMKKKCNLSNPWKAVFSLYLPLSLENANFVALLCLLFLATYEVSYHSQTGGCLVKSVGLNRKHLETSCNLMVSSITAHYIPKHVSCYFDKTTIISYYLSMIT